ncbi:MAG: protein translocase subunit SecD [Dehalococcoidia bacterium]
MRRFARHLRVLALVAVIVGLSVASIAIRDVNLSFAGATLQRGGDGPLGLRLGLDLQGGSHLVYQTALADASDEQIEGALGIIERRINAFGVAEPVIQRLGSDRILVQLPGVENIEEAKRLIGQTARLEFKERTCSDSLCTTFEDRDINLTGEDLTRAFPDTHPTTGEAVVTIQFNSRGTRIFADLTRRIAGDDTKRIAIFLDDGEIIAPVAQEPILTGSSIIRGPDFTPERVRTIAIQLESGRLPVPLELVAETSVDATLGTDSLRRSYIAGLIGFGLVLLFMVLYYRMVGVVASMALLVYLAIVLAIFKLVPITLTLAGIAAFILSIGMAVDANILIFERMKEELRLGRSLASAMDIGFSRAWPAIRDSNISTFLITAILFWFGSRLGATLVMGFALTLFVGVAVSMFTAIVVSKNLLQIMALTPLRGRHSLFSPEAAPSRRRVPGAVEAE